MDRGLQPGRLDARPAGRAHARGRLRRVRLRAGRLDQQPIGRSRPGPGIPARQRGLRGRPLRRRAGHAPHVHPPCEGRQAAHGSPRDDRGALPGGADGGRHAGGEPEAPEGDRGRRSTDAGSRETGGSTRSRCAASASRRRSASSGSRAIGRAASRSPAEAGRRTAPSPSRYWSVASKERRDPPSVFYYWKGERPRHPNAPQLEGTGEIRLESADRASGYWITRSDVDPRAPRADGRRLSARRSGRHGHPRRRRCDVRAGLLAARLREWKTIRDT